MNDTRLAQAQTKSSAPESTASMASGMQDFDFLVGHWTVKHHRLKHRLANSQDWETFDGTMAASLYLDGQGIVDDNVLNLPGAGAYRAITLRAYNPATQKWSIWWLDSRRPDQLDPPLVGGFRDGVGTFFTNDTYDGKSIRVRFIWSEITATSARWEQAFSLDGGLTWEVNWIMEFTRTSSER
jgi:hypothetical protein